MKDNVNHPDHYQNIAGVETIDILNDVVKDLPGKQAAMLWNSMKYLFRFQKKNGVEDLKKARNYLDYLIADMDATCDAADGKYESIFVYKSSSSEEAKNIKTNNDPYVIYGSKTFGNAKVYYSTHMFAGTCKSIVFPSDFQRCMFIASFFAKLTAKDFKVYSIRDVLSDSNFVVPDGTDNFSTKLAWKDIFSKFEMRTEGEKYILDFIYWIKTGTKNKCISYHSSVWGNADVYYSTDMPEGSCTKILFDDEDGRNTFAIKFFRYMSIGAHRFSIQDILEDATYLFPREDNSLHFTMPWNEIFKGFHMTNENGKYVLEFIIDLQGGK